MKNRLVKIIAFLLLFSILLSAVYIAVSADHGPCTDNCRICLRIAAAAEILKLFAAGMAVFASIGIANIAICAKRTAKRSTLLSSGTPAALKVRLNN